jgi:5-methylcytosine-specific restriction endonuclease McrA
MNTHPYGGPWPRVRRTILERDDYRCQINGPNCKTHATTVDHIISWQAGGAWYDPANLRAACGPCNYGRTKYVAIDRDEAGVSANW